VTQGNTGSARGHDNSPGAVRLAAAVTAMSGAGLPDQDAAAGRMIAAP
jgi:hypothetical protein